MIYIGVDPSLTGTGIVSSTGESKLIKTNQLSADIDRIMYIVKEIERFIQAQILENDVIIGIEGFSFHSKGRSISQLFGLGWHLRISCKQLGYTYYEIPPLSWKKLLFGGTMPKGGGKDLVLLRTYKAYDKEFSDNNLCDAYNIMKFTELMHNRYKKKELNISKISLSTLDKVLLLNKLTLDSG